MRATPHDSKLDASSPIQETSSSVDRVSCEEAREILCDIMKKSLRGSGYRPLWSEGGKGKEELDGGGAVSAWRCCDSSDGGGAGRVGFHHHHNPTLSVTVVYHVFRTSMTIDTRVYIQKVTE